MRAIAMYEAGQVSGGSIQTFDDGTTLTMDGGGNVTGFTDSDGVSFSVDGQSRAITVCGYVGAAVGATFYGWVGGIAGAALGAATGAAVSGPPGAGAGAVLGRSAGASLGRNAGGQIGLTIGEFVCAY